MTVVEDFELKSLTGVVGPVKRHGYHIGASREVQGSGGRYDRVGIHTRMQIDLDLVYDLGNGVRPKTHRAIEDFGSIVNPDIYVVNSDVVVGLSVGFSR